MRVDFIVLIVLMLGIGGYLFWMNMKEDKPDAKPKKQEYKKPIPFAVGQILQFR